MYATAPAPLVNLSFTAVPFSSCQAAAPSDIAKKNTLVVGLTRICIALYSKCSHLLFNRYDVIAVSVSGDATVAERLPQRYRYGDVHWIPVACVRRTDVSRSRWVSCRRSVKCVCMSADELMYYFILQQRKLRDANSVPKSARFQYTKHNKKCSCR